MKEIFIRKEKIERELNIKDDNKSDIDKSEVENLLSQLYQHLEEEINEFKEKREKDIVKYMKIFFKERYDLNVEIRNIYSLSSIIKN
jgi:hypothetical protein